jgi:protein-tyrosine phosphatase
MIDLHCHLLPGVDDGPETLQEALQLAQLACANGITHAVVTPHMHWGRYDNDRQSIATAVQGFKEDLAQAGIALQLDYAAEVRIGPEIMMMVEQENLPFLGTFAGYQLLLLEFPHDHIPIGSDKLVTWLLSHHIRPLIAHPERNKDVMRNVNKIIPFVEQGCLLQVTAASVAGGFGPQAKQVSQQLLEHGWVSVLASDAHNVQHRPPDLEPGRAAAEKIIGYEASWALVRDTPRAFVGH